MSWQQAELDALRRAYATGARRVTVDGRTVEYESEDALLRRIRLLEREMGAATGKTLPFAGLAGFRRGDR